MVKTSTTSTVPTTRPSACGMPTQPATVARWRTGTWSGIAALRLAYSPFWNALNSTHSTATPTTVCCVRSARRQMAASRAMDSVQRCRRPRSRQNPNAPVVRSDSAPATGVAMTEAIAPTAETTASATILWCGVMSWSCWGSLTCSGVSEAIHMPRDARPSPVIQPPRTCTVGSASAGESAGDLVGRPAPSSHLRRIRAAAAGPGERPCTGSCPFARVLGRSGPARAPGVRRVA